MSVWDKAKESDAKETTSRRVALTDKHLRSLKPGDGGKPIDYSDTVQRGLRFRVSPSGERTFLFAYRKPGKPGHPETRKSMKIKIASLADGITLAKARREAADFAAGLRREPPLDPAEERARRRNREKAEKITFSDVLNAFKVEELPRYRRATSTGWERYIDREIRPALGDMLPSEITSGHIAGLRETVSRGVIASKAKDGTITWARKPAPVSARRIFEVLRRVLAWLATADPVVDQARRRHGLAPIPTNPAALASTFHRTRNRLKGDARAAMKNFTDEQLRATFNAAREVADLAENVASERRAKGEPALLAQAPGIEVRGLLHNMRHTIKTRMSEHGIDRRVSEDVLGHALTGIEGDYDHSTLMKPRREALDWWSAELGRILSGKEGTGEAGETTGNTQASST